MNWKETKNMTANQIGRWHKKQKAKERAIKAAKLGGRPVRPENWQSLSYKEYLLSDWWKWRRKRKLKKAAFHCEKCGSNKKLQVHHLSYESLWFEKDEHLQVLCNLCHQHSHQLDLDAKLHLMAIQLE